MKTQASDVSEPMLAESRESRWKRSTVWLMLIVALGAFVRLFHLGSKPLWQDEAWSWQFTQKSWPELFSFLLHHEINMSPYHVLLKAWIACFGDSEPVLRTLSVIAALVTIPVVYAIGKRLFDSRVGLVASLLLALNAFHLRYSQEARGYALAVLLVSLSALLLVKAVERSSLKLWLSMGMLLALATYVHMFAALVAAALGMSLLLVPRGRLRMGHVVAGVLAFGVLIAPLVWLAHLQGAARLGWIRPMNWRALAVFLKHFCGNSGFPLAAVVVICLIAALVLTGRLWAERDREQAWRYTMLLFWLLIPIILTAIVSIWRPLFLPRYLLICSPAMVLVLAATLCSWRSRVWAGVVLAVLLIMSVRGIVAYYHKDFDVPRADWPAAVRHIAQRVEPGDIVATRGSDSTLVYYERKLPATKRSQIFAQEGEAQRPTVQALESHERVWCLVKNKDFGLDPFDQEQNAELLSACGAGKALVTTQEVKGLEILLYTREIPR